MLHVLVQRRTYVFYAAEIWCAPLLTLSRSRELYPKPASELVHQHPQDKLS